MICMGEGEVKLVRAQFLGLPLSKMQLTYLTEINWMPSVVNQSFSRLNLSPRQRDLRLHCDFVCQAVQIKKKEVEEKDVGKDTENNKGKGEEAYPETEKEEEKQSDPEVPSKEQKKEKITGDVKASKLLGRPKMMEIKVTLLDNTFYECELDVRTF